MTDEEYKRYFLWSGLRDEMARLKAAYAPGQVPIECWTQLERLCHEAAANLKVPK